MLRSHTYVCHVCHVSCFMCHVLSCPVMSCKCARMHMSMCCVCMFLISLQNGASALFLASTYGHDLVIELLLASDADIDAHNHDGQTPLIRAILADHPTTVQLLVSAGADLSARDVKNKQSAMQITQPAQMATLKRAIEAGEGDGYV